MRRESDPTRMLGLVILLLLLVVAGVIYWLLSTAQGMTVEAVVW